MGRTWLAPVAVLAVFMPASAAAQPSASAVACSDSDVVILGAAGSGELDRIKHPERTDYMGPEVFSLAARLALRLRHAGERVSLTHVAYPALSTDVLKPTTFEVLQVAKGSTDAALADYAGHLGRYRASLRDGTAATVRQLHAIASACPDSDIVAIGYSQGAMIIHQAERRLRSANDDDTLDAIAGTVLLADGDRVPSSRATAFGGSPPSHEGIRTWLRGIGDIRPRDVEDPEHTASICAPNDFVCDFNPSRFARYFTFVGIHKSYFGRPVLAKAADWFAGDVLGLDDASAHAAGMPVIGRRGVGRVRLGRSYAYLRRRRLVGPIRPDCEARGPASRFAPLTGRLRGSVTFGKSRRAQTITITRGAVTSRGLRIGQTLAQAQGRYPSARFKLDPVFRAYLGRVPRGGGQITIWIDGLSRRVTALSALFPALCE